MPTRQQVRALLDSPTILNTPRAGVSVDLMKGSILTGVGFCVAYNATQGSHNDNGFNNCWDHAMGPNGSKIIGAWSEKGVTYYDSVKKYSTRTAAVIAAQKEKQIAIYNLNTTKVEYIMEGESFQPSLKTGRKRSHSF